MELGPKLKIESKFDHSLTLVNILSFHAQIRLFMVSLVRKEILELERALS